MWWMAYGQNRKHTCPLTLSSRHLHMGDISIKAKCSRMENKINWEVDFDGYFTQDLILILFFHRGEFIMHSHPSVLWWGLYSVSRAILDFTLGIHSVKWAAQTKANTADAGTSRSTQGHLFSGSRKEEKVRERRKGRWKGGRKGKKEGNLSVRFSVVLSRTWPLLSAGAAVCRVWSGHLRCSSQPSRRPQPSWHSHPSEGWISSPYF